MSLHKLTLVLVLLGCLCAPAAQASEDQASIMMDDDQLLYRSSVTQTRTLVTMRAAGVDAVRATMLWKVVAEGASLTNKEIDKLKTKKQRDQARAQRARFKANDPRTYPTRNWDRYDNLVKEATKLQMRVYFTITGPGPRYGMGIAPKSQRANAGTYKPKPAEYAKFVEAVGKRFSGQYRDENAGRRALPRVSIWSLWNEPNQPGWLSPQSESVNGQVVPVAPALYRELHMAGVTGLTKTGHGGDAIFLGETAPLGSDKSGPANGLHPVPFLREMLCLKADGSSYTGADAARRNCDKDFANGKTLKSTAFAHHPYTKNVAPTVAPKSPEDITMANIGTLGPLLDTLAAQSGGKIASGQSIFLSEFGYESNPPDTRNGIPLMRQAQFNQLGEFLAYNQPRVAATTQFLLLDAPPVKRSPITGKKYKVGSREYWFTYQSGLYNAKRQAKPAAFAYNLPFVVYPAGDGVLGFWGQLRFRENTLEGFPSPDSAVILWCPTDASTAAALAQCEPLVAGVPSSYRGFFSGSTPARVGGFYRAAFIPPPAPDGTQGAPVYSLPAKL